MEIIQTEQNGIVIFTIKGRLDAESAPEAEKIITDTIAADQCKLIFDLSDLEYLSSGGLRVVLTTSKETGRKDGKIVLCCLNEYVKEIFEVSGFHSIIPIVDTVELGIKEFS